MTDKTYVALAPLRFGDGLIQPGEVVPHIPGRDYARLVELRQITEQVVVSGEAAPAFPQGEEVLFVQSSGEMLRVEVAEQLPLPDEVAAELQPGEQALWVRVLDLTGDLLAQGFTAEPFVVPARQLVDNDVAENLLKCLEAAHKAGEQQDAGKISALETKLAEVQSELKQAQEDRATAETKLAEVQSELKQAQEDRATAETKLAEAQTEVEALQGALAEAQARPSSLPEDALARLEAVSGISDKLAKKALAALSAPAESTEGKPNDDSVAEADADAPAGDG